MSNQFLDEYASSVSRMGVRAEKPVINSLTMIATDAAASYGQQVVGVIEAQLLRAPSEAKLPILYLIDSIMFNDQTGTYRALFSNNMTTVFPAVYREMNAENQGRMLRLISNSWTQRRNFLHPHLITQLRARIDPNYRGLPPDQLPKPPKQMPPTILSQQQHQPMPQYQQVQPAMQPHTIPQLQLIPPVQFQHDPHQSYQFQMQQKAAELLSNLQSQVVPPVPLHEQMTLQQVQFERPELYNQILSKAQEELGMVGIFPPAHAQQGQPIGQPISTLPPQTSALPSHSTIPPAVMQQPLPTTAHVATSYSDLGLPSFAEVLLSETLDNQKPVTLNEINILKDSIKKLPKPSTDDEREDPRIASLLKSLDQIQLNIDADFSTDNLKNHDIAMTAVNLVYNLGINGTIKHVESDLIFSSQHVLDQFIEGMNKEKLKLQKLFNSNNQVADVKDSINTTSIRGWYLTEEEWVEGAEKVSREAVTFFDNLDAEAKDEEEEDYDEDAAVVADDNQKTCPLCGEAFETYWDDDAQEWMYKGAIRPDPNGPIYMLKAFKQQSSKDKKRLIGSSADGPSAKKTKTG